MRWKAEMFVSLFFISEHIVMWSTFKYQLDRLLCLTWFSLATNSCRILETLSAKFANIELISAAYAEFISPSYLCRATFMTNRIHGGKTVAGAIWLLASKLLFIVSFHFFFLWCQAEEKWQKKWASWVSVRLVLICADLVLQDSLTSVTHTSHCRKKEGEVEGRRGRCGNGKGDCPKKQKTSQYLFGHKNQMKVCVPESE